MVAFQRLANAITPGALLVSSSNGPFYPLGDAKFVILRQFRDVQDAIVRDRRGFWYKLTFAVGVAPHPFAISHRVHTAAIHPNNSTHSLTGLSAVHRSTLLVSSAGSSDSDFSNLRIIVGAK